MSNRRGAQALEISSVFTFLAILVVLLRLYTRFFIVRYFAIEEYLITLAMLCSIGLTACIGIQMKYGMGKHMADTRPEDTPNALKAFWSSLIFYNLSLGMTKVSIILQYFRVFPLHRVRIACYVILFIVSAYTIWTVFGSIFACIPVQAFWTRQEANCLNQYAMWFTNAAINILSDFALVILPMPVIRSLDLSRRQKQALIGVFAVGGFVCVVSILRLKSLTVISNSIDPIYNNPPAATWSSVETNVGIICSCLPYLRPLMAHALPGMFPSSHKRSVNRARIHAEYLRQYDPATALQPMDSTFTPDAANNKSSKNGLHIVTEVHVEVEKKDGVESGGTGCKRVLSMKSGNSTNTLVTDVASIV